MSEFADLKTELRNWPHGSFARPNADPVFARLRQAIDQSRPGSTGVGLGDLAVLVRQVLRREAALHGGFPKLIVPALAPWPTKAAWRHFGCRALGEAERFEVEAEAWKPAWEPSEPFAAAEYEMPRRTSVPVPADPPLLARFKRSSYLSRHQAEAIRSVLLSPSGSVRLIVLPTGAGKSLVGISAAMLGWAESGGSSVFVVPTIALALDQVRQSQALCPGVNVDAWHSGLNSAERRGIRARLRDGTQRVIFCAPESIVGPLSEALFEIAARGQLRAFVIDEAHLVSQWGTSFRPEFQSMSTIWRSLRDRCPLDRVFRTLLTTATLTQEAFRDIKHFFGAAGQFETQGAVYIRQEPDFFRARCATEIEQVDRVLEVLRHAPRPAILYLTRVVDAKAWYQRCLAAGWRRTGLMHGECSRSERERVLEAWNRNEIDLMVATSAFGLGMDKSDVRLVLHACVPETVDRFYQEVGRGGRDGRASVSFLLWTEADLARGSSMSRPAIVGDEIGFSRWKSMWTTSRQLNGVPMVNLNAKRPGVDWDGERNIEWNLKTLLLLARAGVLELQHASLETQRLPDESDDAFAARCERLRQDYESYSAVRFLQNNPTTAAAWEQQVGSHREAAQRLAAANWTYIEDILRGRRDLQAVLREVYCVPDAGIFDVGANPGEVELPPPHGVCHELGEALQRVVPTSGLLLVTYATAGLTQREIGTRLVEALKSLAKQGVREVALPTSWRTQSPWLGSLPNPLLAMTAQAPERFLMVRDLGDRDPNVVGSLAVPRVTVLPPSHAPNPIPIDLLTLNRPVHLVLVPDECRDRQNPARRVGDVAPEAIRIENLLIRLKQ